MPPIVIRSALALLALTVCAYASVLPHQTIVRVKLTRTSIWASHRRPCFDFRSHKAVRTSVSSRILVKSSTAAASHKTEERRLNISAIRNAILARETVKITERALRQAGT